jgi:hypothetical protein
MDQRIEAFLADVLALAGENPDAIRAGVRVAFADCEEIFRAQETNKRMRDKAAHACRALCRARIVEEMQRSCALAANGHVILAPISAMNSRRLILSPVPKRCRALQASIFSQRVGNRTPNR